jgi:hypothetical protein
MSNDEATLQKLRSRFNAAFSTYQRRARVLLEATVSGNAPPEHLVLQEDEALRELTQADRNLAELIATPRALRTKSRRAFRLDS